MLTSPRENQIFKLKLSFSPFLLSLLSLSIFSLFVMNSLKRQGRDSILVNNTAI